MAKKSKKKNTTEDSWKQDQTAKEEVEIKEEQEEKPKARKLSEKEKIEKARQRRLALAEQRHNTQSEGGKGQKKPSAEREEFREYFSKIRKKIDAPKELEHVLWAHLKAIKHDKKELFEAGLKHFGYKI